MRCISSALHAAARFTSAACSGRALMLGIARYSFNSSTYRSRFVLMKSMTLFMSAHFEQIHFALFRLDRQILPIAPLLPPPRVVPHSRIAEQAQVEVGMGGAIAALAIRHDLLVAPDARPFVHRTQLRCRLERAVGGQVTRPLDVHRARDGPTPLRPDD